MCGLQLKSRRAPQPGYLGQQPQRIRSGALPRKGRGASEAVPEPFQHRAPYVYWEEHGHDQYAQISVYHVQKLPSNNGRSGPEDRHGECGHFGEGWSSDVPGEKEIR